MFKYLKNKRLKSTITNNNRYRTFLDFNSIKNVLILFENKNLEEIEHIANDLSKGGKNVYLWTSDPSKTVVHPQRQSLALRIITRDDISLLGNVKTDILSVFHSQQYDTIIDLTLQNEYPLQYLLADNKAMFSVGIRESENKLYDFVLLKNEDMSIKDAFIQIKFYLNNMWTGANNS